MSTKIQIRRGNKADLPNPLDNGEMGWADDTKQLYIGNGVVNENLFVAGEPETDAFSVYCASSTYGGDTIANGMTGRRLDSTLGTGTTTATSANKLVNGNKDFTTETLVGLTVFNTTDGTWAKITAVDSATTLSLSADIMTSGEDYEIVKAISTIAEAWSVIPAPFSADVTLQIAPGTYAGWTAVGKAPTGNFSVTVNGSGSSGGSKTTINSTIEVRQRVAFSNFETTSDVRARYGADITWTSCVQTSPSLMYTYEGSSTTTVSGTYTVGNNPLSLSNQGATVATGYTIYTAGSTYGGSAGNDGLQVTAGSATSTSANKLVDSAAAFTSALVGKTVWNSTDDTWAKVTAVDSSTQLSLSADIMASGESYVVASACSTPALAFAQIPGQVNCNIVVKLSPETFAATTYLQGKTMTGAYTITIQGTRVLTESLTAGSGSTNATAVNSAWTTACTVVRSSGTWTVNQRSNYWCRMTSGVNSGEVFLIDTNTTTTLTLIGRFLGGTVANGDTFRVETLGTVMNDLRIGHYQGNVIVNDVSLEMATGTNQDLFGRYVQAVFNRCNFKFAAASSLWTGKAADIRNSSCYFANCRLFVRSSAKYYSQGNKHEGGAYGRVAQLDEGGILYLGDGTVLDPLGVAGTAVNNSGLGLVNGNGDGHLTTGSTTHVWVRNTTTGITTAMNSVSLNVLAASLYVRYTSVTANTSTATGGQES